MTLKPIRHKLLMIIWKSVNTHKSKTHTNTKRIPSCDKPTNSTRDTIGRPIFASSITKQCIKRSYLETMERLGCELKKRRLQKIFFVKERNMTAQKKQKENAKTNKSKKCDRISFHKQQLSAVCRSIIYS